jgi:hypothetical protein
MSGSTRSAIWGLDMRWPCGHRALILDPDHDLWGHPHWCPICRPDSLEPGCDADYRDAH